MKDKNMKKKTKGKDFKRKKVQMKDKNMKKKTKGKDFKRKKDMKNILSDPRFSHVTFDAKLRHMPKEEHKVKLDSRFSSMFTDDKFYEKETMDPRGRTGNYSTKENLRKFYDMPSDKSGSEDEEEEGEEKEEEEEKEAEKSKSEDETKDSESAEEQEEESEGAETKKLEKEEETNKSYEEAGEGPAKPKISPEVLERLQDMNQDYARGVALFSDDSSDDDTSSDEEKENEFEWGALDQDAVWDSEQQNVEETSRFAACNLDWNNMTAVDIMVVFHSFCPSGGSVKKVVIYPSEFGKQRMAEEDKFGPSELVNMNIAPTSKSKRARAKEVDLDKLEKGKLDFRSEGLDHEVLRQYERNRLKYYYAVVECDSVETAIVVYKQCDGQAFEGAGFVMDLRYIPDDMTFDETPKDECDSIPEFYAAKLFTTTALLNSQPTLTWDQTDPHRKKVLSNAMQTARSGAEIDDERIKNFIASSSEDESDLAEEEGDYSSDEEEMTKKDRIAAFRALIQEIDEKERKKKEGPFDMETVFGVEENENDSDDSEENTRDKKNLNPFEQYLEKKRMKRQEKREQKEAQQKNDSDEEGGDQQYSDDEIPGGMEALENDPFFAEELKERKKEMKGKKEKKNKKKKKGPQQEDSENEEQGNLQLLLMDEDNEDKKHFSMREIIEDHKQKSKKKLKKKDRKKLAQKSKEEDIDTFKIDTADPRFSSLFSSGEYNLDPSHPQFKRTKAVDDLINDVQKKRIAETYENMPEPKRTNTTKGKDEHELSMLVKRVKNKAKKPK